MKIEDHGIDGFDPLAHTPMEFTVQSAIDNLKSIRNKKVDLPIAVLESLKDSLIKKNKEEELRKMIDEVNWISDPEQDTHDIPKPTEQYDIDVLIRGKSDLPNPHEINEWGQYCDSTITIRESCGCTEANVAEGIHNVCTVKRYHVRIPYFYDSYVDATSERGAIEIAHEEGNGKMGECVVNNLVNKCENREYDYDADNILVEEISARETN